MIPNKLNDWSFQKITNLVNSNISESDIHDFKKSLPNKETLTKICCSFANSKGGFVILGVKELAKKFKICGIDNDKELSCNFGKKLKSNPIILYDLPKIIPIPDSKKIIAVFEILLSPYRPHLPDFDEGKRIFYKRTNKGNSPMTYEEIRYSFQNLQERREKLKMLYIELLSNSENIGYMTNNNNDGKSYSLITLDSTIINGILVDLYTIISENKELIRNLLKIREKIKIINNKITIFFGAVSIPTTNKKMEVIEHNQFIHGAANELNSILLDTLKILESKFDLKNPLQ